MFPQMPLTPLAEGPGWLIGLVVCFLIFGGGGMVVAMLENWNKTRVQIAQLRQQQQSGGDLKPELDAVRQELTALRKQMSELRDTTTQYDLSLDTALQRMERRVEHVEQQQQQQIRA